MNLWDRNSDSHQTLWQVLVPYTFVNSCIKVPVPLILIHLIAHAIDLRRAGDITKRKIKVLQTKMKNLLGESLTHLDEEFESFKKGILKVKDYLFTFLTDLHVPYDNNASERGVRKIKIKQKVSGCFRTDSGADDFAKLHSIAETAMKNGNSKFNAILAVVQQ